MGWGPGGDAVTQPLPYVPAAAHVAPHISAMSDAPVKPLGGAHVTLSPATNVVKLPKVLAQKDVVVVL